MCRRGLRAITCTEVSSPLDSAAWRGHGRGHRRGRATYAGFEHRRLETRSPAQLPRAVPLDVLSGRLGGVGRSEVSAVPAKDVDPLLSGIVEGAGNDVGDVVMAAPRHADVRRSGTGGLADNEVGVVDGVALGAVHGGGVREFDVLVDVSRPAALVGRLVR